MSVFVERRRKAEDPRVGTPRSIGGEAARGEMVQADAVLEVSDGILDLERGGDVGLQFQGLPVPVGDEAVIAVGSEEGQLGTGRGLHSQSRIVQVGENGNRPRRHP